MLNFCNTESKVPRIFVTGGHFTPALAVIEKLVDKVQVFYVGRKYAMEDGRAFALEYQELANRPDIKYLSIVTGRLQRRFFVNVGQSIKSLLKIPVGIVQALWWLIKFQPRLILSFGGYVAVPVAIGAWLLDIPILTHEQTPSVGLANRIIRFLGAEVLNIGNPLRKEILMAKPKITQTIFITGGNQGSLAINQVIEKIVKQLTRRYTVIHQTGDYNVRVKDKRYYPRKFVSAKEMANYLSRAKIVISRAGANITEEIAYLGKPAILIPLPWSSGDEQLKNAQKLANVGLAEILEQKYLTENRLLALIEKIENSYNLYISCARMARKLVDPKAADKIAEAIERRLYDQSDNF